MAALKSVQERFQRAGYRAFIGDAAPTIKNVSAVYLTVYNDETREWCRYCKKRQICIKQVFATKNAMTARIAEVGDCCPSCGFFISKTNYHARE